jgi:hypothetical protein
VIPAEQADTAVTARLINILRIGEVDVEQAAADFDADGKHYTRGSYIIPLAQPYGGFARTLLEVQNYPNIPEYPGGPLQRPYDVTAQTLPLLFGVTAVAVNDKLTVPTSKVDAVKPARGHFAPSSNGNGYLIADTTNSSLYALFTLLAQGVHTYRLTGAGTQAGTIYIPKQPGVDTKLAAIANRFPIEIQAAATSPIGGALEVHLPRIALYQSWVASMDEGWTRWIFDQNNIPYTRVVDADLRKGDLNQRFDVVLIPDNPARAILFGRQPLRAQASGADGGTAEPQTPPEFRGGIGDEGLASLKAFTEAGGTIITLNRASELYTKKDAGAVANALDGVDKKAFFIPGSILQISVNPSNPIAFGSTPTVPIFYEDGPTFKVSGDAHSVASFTTDKPLLSGWILGGQFLKGTSVIAQEPVGKGNLILFGFRPQYRAQSEVTYKFLFNALLYSSSKAVSLGRSSAQLGTGAARHKGGQ